MKPYEERVIGLYEDDRTQIRVSTAWVEDSLSPIETAVCHPEYSRGKVIVVQNHDDPARALRAHQKWVRVMTGDRLPSRLIEVSRCLVTELARLLDPRAMVSRREET